MKILIGILVIVLAVFLNCVELSTPEKKDLSSGPSTAPIVAPSPSGRKQTGRGGRYARQQSKRTAQQAAAPQVPLETPPGTSQGEPPRASPAAPPRASPGAPSGASPGASRSTPRINPTVNISAGPEAMPKGTYIEDPRRGFIKMKLLIHVDLFAFNNILIGRIVDDDVLPIFNRGHEIIRIDYRQGGLRIPMNRTEAQRWGVFGKCSQLKKTPPPAFYGN